MNFVLEGSKIPHPWDPCDKWKEIEYIVPIPWQIQCISEIQINTNWNHCFIHHIRVFQVYFGMFERIT